ncbi:MAG: LysM peptidoglycan-binding domain-containing protein [Cyclobacteriaceae bacterium]
MKKILLLVLFFAQANYLVAQEVPSRLRLGNMELKLSNSLRSELQKQADQLSRYPKYFNIKLTKAKLYFPIIERIFREENVPDEFKYLVIQESALIADAVSTANAVGFWQFKIEAATEVGLRVDRQLDERMNIVSATRGAARYLKSNNFYYDNWVYALLAYNTGRGGARRYVDERYYGARTMELDKNTHWYVKTFLAHMIAVQSNYNQCPDPDFYLYEFEAGAGKSLKQIAGEFAFDENELVDYNKWLKRGSIPLDKPYSVIIPIKGKRPNQQIAQLTSFRQQETKKVNYDFGEQDKFPVIEKEEEHPGISIVEINDKKGVVANEGDTPGTLSRMGGISVTNFLNYNDMVSDDAIVPGQVYYFQKKRNKAKAHYHVVMPQENWWSISQKYAIKLHKLMQKNRVRKDEEVKLKSGRVLWLRFIRPASIPIAYEVVEEPKQPTPEKIKKEMPVSQVELPLQKQTPEPFAAKEEIQIQENKEPATIGNNDVETLIIKKESINDTSTEEKPNSYTVKPGDTFYSIARQFDVSIAKLKSINNLPDDWVLQTGQSLLLIEQESIKTSTVSSKKQQNESKSYIYHQVAPGETLYKIARQYNVTIKQLMEWNDKEDFNLKSGESLRLIPNY